MLSRILLAGAGLVALATAMPAAARSEAAATPPPAVVAPPIEFTEWTLGNGLRVIAIQDSSTPTVMTSMWYAVGSKHDPEGRSGFAHLFEHILSRKTVNMPYNMVNRLTEDVGGVRNASTGDSRTNYFEIVPAQYLETVLWTHAERMANPVVDAEVFERERAIVKEELRQRVLAPPYGRFMRYVIPENVFDVLPQRRSGIGSIEQLDAATLDDARAFHQAFYGPDTATLIVAGNFDPARLRAMVDQYFAAIPRRANPASLAITAVEPPRTAPRRVEATAPGVPLPMVGASWKLPGATSPDRAALEVLDMILSAGDNSRYHRALVRSGMATQVIQYIDFSPEGGFAVQAAVPGPAGQDIEALGRAMLAEMERVRAEPVTAAELAEAKNELLSAALAERETVRGRAFELGEALMNTGDPRAADTRLAAISAVTVADVQRVARQYFAPDARVDLRYAAGPDNPASWTNPAPMPRFGTVPPAVGQPLVLRDEASRVAPPAPGAAPAIRAPDIAETRLANGVTVVSARTGTVPVASISVLLPGGSASDTRERAGVAQYAVSLATKGTATMSAEQIAARMESLGAAISTAAGPDGEVLTVTAPVANLGAAGEVLADIVRNASFPEEEFQLERKRGFDSLQVAMKDPGTLAAMAVPALMFGDAPYGTLAGGTADSLGRMTRDDLVAHRRQWWHPAVAKVVIAGGIGNDEAAALAGRLFGGWQSDAPPPAPVTARAGAALPPRTVVIDMPEAGQAAVVAALRTMNRKDGDYYPLLLANSVLGVGSNGRLFEEVRTRRGLSYGAYSSLQAMTDAGLLTASAQTKNETAAEVAQVFLEQFARLGNEPLAGDALERRRLFLGGSTQRSLETSGGFSGLVGNLLLQGLAPAEALRFAERLSAVTPEAASAAARRYVAPEQATLVIVGNSALFLDKLRALRGDVTVIPAASLNLAQPVAAAQ